MKLPDERGRYRYQSRILQGGSRISHSEEATPPHPAWLSDSSWPVRQAVATQLASLPVSAL